MAAFGFGGFGAYGAPFPHFGFNNNGGFGAGRPFGGQPFGGFRPGFPAHQASPFAQTQQNNHAPLGGLVSSTTPFGYSASTLSNPYNLPYTNFGAAAPTAQTLAVHHDHQEQACPFALSQTVCGTFFTHSGLPSPKIVDIVAAVKGVRFENTRELDIVAGDNRSPEILEKVPTGQVPFIELPGGTILTETTAIALWLEDTHPSPPLFGETSEERAVTLMHAIRLENYVNSDILNAWRCSDSETGGYKIFASRRPVDPAASALFLKRAMHGLDLVEADLAASQRDFVAWGRPSFADIPLFCVLDFFFGFGEKPLAPDAEAIFAGRPALAAWWLRVLDLFGEHANARTQASADVAKRIVAAAGEAATKEA